VRPPGAPGRFGRVAVGAAVLVLVSGGAVAAAGRFGHNATGALRTSGELKRTGSTVGSRPFASRVVTHGYRLELRVAPNRASVAAAATLVLTKRGKPVSGARVRLTYSMPGMAAVIRRLPQRGSGRYADAGPVLGMSGRWGLRVEVAPPRAAPFSVRLVDRMRA
jgi:YtkA-like